MTNVSIPIVGEMTETHWPKGREFRIGPIVVNSSSISKAKEAARLQLQMWLNSWHAPETIAFEHGAQGETVFVTIISCPSVQPRTEVEFHWVGMHPSGRAFNVSERGGFDDWAQARTYAARRLADLVLDSHDDESVRACGEFIVNFGGTTTGRENLRKMLHNVGFQRAYRHVIGDVDLAEVVDPHRWAGEHSDEFIPDIAIPC